MKKLFFFVAFLIEVASLTVSTAQTIRFTDTTNRWKTRTTIYPNDEPISSIQFFEVSDSLREWNGQLYSEITEDGVPVLYVREDTLMRKVYVAPILSHIGAYTVSDNTTEFEYMDFSLVEGDTFTFPLRNEIPDHPADSISRYWVHSIDSINLGANWYKRMWMQRISGIGHSSPFESYWAIEGIGFGLPFGISNPIILTQGTFEWPPQLICFSNNGIIPSPPFQSTCFDPVDIQEHNKNSHAFLAYPNPADDMVHIELYLEAKNLVLDIMDITGKILQRHTIKNRSTHLNVENFAEGIYILKLSGDNVTATYRKLKIH